MTQVENLCSLPCNVQAQRREAWGEWPPDAASRSVGRLTAGDFLEPRLEQPALRLGGNSRITTDRRQQPVETFGGGVLEIEDHVPDSANGARPAGQVAEGFLADSIAEVFGELPGLLE